MKFKYIMEEIIFWLFLITGFVLSAGIIYLVLIQAYTLATVFVFMMLMLWMCYELRTIRIQLEWRKNDGRKKK